MGCDYYYFAASLPMLQWNGKPSVTIEEFCDSARRLLNEQDGLLVTQLLADSDAVETDNAVAGAWVRFNRNFHNEIAVFRAQQAHQDPMKVVHGSKENEPALRDLIQEASRMDNLLEAEKLLDLACWQFLDDQSSGHYYDLEFLICYGLKLKILQKHQSYASSAGPDVFKSIQAMELPVDWAASAA